MDVYVNLSNNFSPGQCGITSEFDITGQLCELWGKKETKLQYFCDTINLWFEKCFTYYIISSSPQHKKIDVLIIPISQMRTLRLWEIL